MIKSVQVLFLLLVGAGAAQLVAEQEAKETPEVALNAAARPVPQVAVSQVSVASPARGAILGMAADTPSPLPMQRFTCVNTAAPPGPAHISLQAIRVIHVGPGAGAPGLEPRS